MPLPLVGLRWWGAVPGGSEESRGDTWGSATRSHPFPTYDPRPRPGREPPKFSSELSLGTCPVIHSQIQGGSVQGIRYTGTCPET